MELSDFGRQFSKNSGILELMNDIGEGLLDGDDYIFLGGGNPSCIEEVNDIYKNQLLQAATNSNEFKKLLGNYQAPLGDKEFRHNLAKFLNNEYGWPVTQENITLSNGSQPAFFILYNMFAGNMEDGRRKTIHFPLVPEFLGYKNLGLVDDLYSASLPTIDLLEDHVFKYRVDFSKFSIDESIGAVSVTRPTNPTGNLITNEEMYKIGSLTTKHSIPFIIDGAYGPPFPNIVSSEVEPYWTPNTILVLSLSKLGLPGARTGIIVANEEVISAFCNINTIINLSSGNIGQYVTKCLFNDRKILNICRDIIAPHYNKKAIEAINILHASMGDVPYYVHKYEGSIFMWIWFKDLPISSQELYERLRSKMVMIVPGHHFFPGINYSWKHKYECIRVSYAQDALCVKNGMQILAEEVKGLY